MEIKLPFGTLNRKYLKPKTLGEARRWGRKQKELYRIPHHNDRHKLRLRAIHSYKDTDRYFDERFNAYD